VDTSAPTIPIGTRLEKLKRVLSRFPEGSNQVSLVRVSLQNVLKVHFQLYNIRRQMACRSLLSNPVTHEPVALNGPAATTVVAIVVSVSSSCVIFPVVWKRLLQPLSNSVILGPHFPFAALPAPLNHWGLLVTLPARIFPYTNHNFGFVWSFLRSIQWAELVLVVLNLIMLSISLEKEIQLRSRV
jgi:hypothetical protein